MKREEVLFDEAIECGTPAAAAAYLDQACAADEGLRRRVERLLVAHWGSDSLIDAPLQVAQGKIAAEKPGQTLGATELVHEAYLRLVGNGAASQGWNSRGHFFAAAAEAMRRILIDHARRRHALVRGGDRARLPLSEIEQQTAIQDQRLLALDEALTRLEADDSQKATLVKLRFFAGLTNEEAAAALNISTATAQRLWAYSRAWLRAEVES